MTGYKFETSNTFISKTFLYCKLQHVINSINLILVNTIEQYFLLMVIKIFSFF